MVTLNSTTYDFEWLMAISTALLKLICSFKISSYSCSYKVSKNNTLRHNGDTIYSQIATQNNSVS